MLRRTRAAFIWTRILGVPFWGLVNLLSIILYKDMHITPLQITVILALKPMSALLAPYWSATIYQRPDRVISNLVWANILRYLPFLFIPWIQSPWLIIAAFGAYMMLYRGVIPAWMEMVKCNLPERARERLVAYGSTIDYCGTALLPLLLGTLLDGYNASWRWLFPATAAVALISTWFLYRIPSQGIRITEHPVKEGGWTLFKGHLLKPWKQSWEIVRENRGFAQFQLGFMLGGAGLMIMQPALPIFFVDILELSYTKLLLALTLAKGIGFAVTSPFWVRLFRKLNIYFFAGLVTVLAALFPFILLSAQMHIMLLYFAYGLYGMMQAGSELSWHMSGPVFAQDKDSSTFSATNVLTVGVRGCVAPALGALILSLTNSTVVMLVGSAFCFLATQQLYRYHRSRKTQAQT